MKRRLFTLLLSLIGLTSIWAESYGLKIGNVLLTSDNYTNITAAGGFDAVKSGTVTYDPATRTLTLNNAVLESSSSCLQIPANYEYTLELAQGTSNTLIGNPTILANGPLTIEGGGTCSLGVTKTSSPIAFQPSTTHPDYTLTIRNCTLTATGTLGGFYGAGTRGHLAIENAEVRVTGNAKGSIMRFATMTLTNAVIDSPTKAEWNQSAHAVCMHGSSDPVTSEVVIVPMIAEEVQIGEISNNTTSSYPFCMNQNYSLTQQIYKPNEIGQAGAITDLAFYYNYTEPFPMEGIQVYMKHVTKNSFDNSRDHVEVGPNDLVYEGRFYVYERGWVNIHLDEPFPYNGTDNLLICCIDTEEGMFTREYTFLTCSETEEYTTFDYATNLLARKPTAYFVHPDNYGTRNRNRNLIRLIKTDHVFPPRIMTPTDFTCAPPAGDGSVATFSWTEQGTATQWQICLDGDETNLITVDSNPYTLTGLTPGQTHTARVRSLVGDMYSVWSFPVTFTPLDAYQFTVNDSTATSVYVPFYTSTVSSGGNHTQIIYEAADLSPIRFATINSMTFYLTEENANALEMPVFDVYIAEVEQANFEGTQEFIDWETLPLVHSGTLTIVGGKMTVTFSTPYKYMGGNLLLGFHQSVKSDTRFSQRSWYGREKYKATVGKDVGSYESIVYRLDFCPKTTIDYTPGIEPPVIKRVRVDNDLVTVEWTGSSDRYKVRYRPLENIFSDNFESGTLDKWTTVRNSEGDEITDWHAYSSLFYPPYAGEYGAKSQSGYYSPAQSSTFQYTVDNWLISPQIPLDGVLTYWHRDNGTPFHQHYEILVSTQSNDIADFEPFVVPHNPWAVWTQQTFDLSSYGGALGYIAFRHNDHYLTNGSDYIELDDVALKQAGEWQWEDYAVPYTEMTVVHLARVQEYELQVIGIKDGYPDQVSPSVTFTTLGYDYNGDGKLNMSDVRFLVNVILGRTIIYDPYAPPTDINGDGHLSVADVTALVNIIKNR